MKIRVILFLIGLCIASVSLIAFTEKLAVTNFPKPIKLKIPKGWPKPPKNIYANNKLTEQGFQLGKKLFYDGRLSKDGEVSCASCHQQFAAFSTYDHDLSHGVQNTFTTRNAPGLFNLVWMNDFHWDGGVNHIEVQPLSPLTAPNEMGENLENILLKLRNDSAYKQLFRAAFGDQQINSERMLKALAQFTGNLISANSKYDRVMRGEDKFTAFEAKGYEVFKAKCSHCHKEPLFTDYSYRNNGLSLNRFNDIGRQKITLLSSDSLKFKVPSLRNAQVSFPYMHDGRIYSIPEVVEHYRTGILIEQPNLDSSLRKRIPMTHLEKNQLVYFIYTLTDSAFISNQRFAPGNKPVQKQQLDKH